MRPPALLPRSFQSLFGGDGVVVRYGVAVASVLAAAFFYTSIDQYLEKQATPFAVFTVPVMIAASFGGLGPGLLATLLAWLIGDYFWVDPLYTFKIVHLHEAVHGAVFLGVGVSISGMSHALRAARARAEAANRAKDDFLAVLSHELRNPLAPVVAAVSSIEQTPDLADDVRCDLDVIRRNVGVQTRLIDDLLDTNRIAHGKLHLRWEAACDAHRVIGDALQVCAAEAAAKRVMLTFTADAARHHVRADPARLLQVFWNLIRNAIKFTPQGGQVTVQTDDIEPGSGSGGRTLLRVRVSDTGMGIAPDDLNRIFQPFEQGSRHTSRVSGGLGIGLALCKGLVELHGGRIDATSQGAGQGSVFIVELPTVNEPVAEAAKPVVPAQQTKARASQEASAAPPSRGNGAPHILLVEDNEDTGPLLARLLRRAGYHVTLAGGMKPALREAEGQHFDLLISDLQLPDGTGIDLLTAIRARQPLRGICISGFGSDADLQQTREAGFDRHLVKPVDVETLREAIDAASGG